ncbi:UNKNOWN [Stylonychia lemnae]|uniref:Uncharacterized protein n=1 Tax=Stylonychia lemnae TaxID=5949 RepID=A0A078A633_STYLE|nr:UNKNOWN [Stylonychia lemnae]|eukprot:CDW77356.1 UNKNOWN [Stylonychia lemnae]
MENNQQSHFATNSKPTYTIPKFSKKRLRENDESSINDLITELQQQQREQMQGVQLSSMQMHQSKRFCSNQLEEQFRKTRLNSCGGSSNNSASSQNSLSGQNYYYTLNHAMNLANPQLLQQQYVSQMSQVLHNGATNGQNSTIMSAANGQYQMQIASNSNSAYPRSHQVTHHNGYNGQGYEASSQMLEDHQMNDSCVSSRHSSASYQNKDELIRRQKDIIKKQLHMYKQQMHFWNGNLRTDCCDADLPNM